MSERRTDDATLIKAVRTLARDIQTEDGVIGLCLAEAAARLETLVEERRWIPVGERLPDKEMPVMVLSAGIAFIACASWGRWLDLGGIDRDLSHVTHWQPLPPGPKTKDEHNVPLQK